MLNVEIISESAPFVRLVRGLVRADLDRPCLREELRSLWIEHGLIVFRGGDHDADFQVELSKCFGELQVHSVKEMLHPERHELMMLHGEPGAGQIMDIDGEELAGYIPWHQDTKFTAESNHGGILQIITLPERGGNTGFIDLIAAYGRLSDAMKHRCENLEIAYRMFIGDDNWQYLPHRTAKITTKADFQDALEERVRGGAFPTVVHPLVFAQPETGRKVLNFSPCFASHVLGFGPEESEALIRELAIHVMAENATYDHVWQAGDMVLWDNWRMVHCARGIPPGERRIGQRTTIAGDYALGRMLEAA